MPTEIDPSQLDLSSGPSEVDPTSLDLTPPSKGYRGPLADKRLTEAGGLFSGRTLEDILRGGTLPTLLGTAGTTAGTALGGPIGGTLGEVGGSMLGEGLNQLFGLTEPSLKAILASGAAGPLTRTAMAGVRGVVGQAAKTFAGREGVSEAAGNVIKNATLPATSSQEFYNNVAKKVAGNSVPLKGIQNTIDELTTKEAQQAIDAGISKGLEPLKNLYTGTKGSAEALFEDFTRLGKLAKDAFAEGNKALGNAYNKVRDSIATTFTEAGIPELRLGSMTFRKEKAIEEIQQAVARAEPARRVKEIIQNDPLIANAFTPQELDKMIRSAKLTSGTVVSGSTGILGRSGTAALGYMLAGPAGAAIGAVAPGTARATFNTRLGQKVIENYLNKGLLVGGPSLPSLATGQTLEAILNSLQDSGNIK